VLAVLVVALGEMMDQEVVLETQELEVVETGFVCPT
jgi:hypothetical protein